MVFVFFFSDFRPLPNTFGQVLLLSYFCVCIENNIVRNCCAVYHCMERMNLCAMNLILIVGRFTYTVPSEISKRRDRCANAIIAIIWTSKSENVAKRNHNWCKRSNFTDWTVPTDLVKWTFHDWNWMAQHRLPNDDSGKINGVRKLHSIY